MPQSLSLSPQEPVGFPAPGTLHDSFTSNAVQKLTVDDEPEALAFLGERLLHTIILTGFIRDNGIESPLNRGTFYAYRDGGGKLEGLALIGHSTLFEVRTESALASFARLAAASDKLHLVMGESENVEAFWHHFTKYRSLSYSQCRELLLIQRWPSPSLAAVPDLRLATVDDLAFVMMAHAQMLEEAQGINPLQSDPTGFRQRCARRIEQQRVWVLVREGQLIFKADVISATSAVNYLEGLYVDPGKRGQGYGSRCVAQLSRHLLAQTQALCVLASEHNLAAQAIYRKAGFELESYYLSIFLQ